MSDDLVKRLRCCEGIGDPDCNCAEAADRIEELEAENNRLREVLEMLPDFIDIYRAIKRSGRRKHVEIAKIVADMLPRPALQETDDE